MERTEIENKRISKIKLSWTGSPTTADGVVHRNYEVVLRKVKFLSKDKTLQKKQIGDETNLLLRQFDYAEHGQSQAS